MKKTLYVLAGVLFLLIMTNPNHSSFQQFLGKHNFKDTDRKANFLVCSIYSDNDKSYFAILSKFYKISQHNSDQPAVDTIKNGHSLQTENPLKTGD